MTIARALAVLALWATYGAALSRGIDIVVPPGSLTDLDAAIATVQASGLLSDFSFPPEPGLPA